MMRALSLALLLLGSASSLHIFNKLPTSLLQSIRTISAATAAAIITASPMVIQPVHADDAQVFVTSLATVIESKAILKPIIGYVKDQAYDNARTNIKVERCIEYSRYIK
jgi:hypothetical protein